MAMKYPAVFLDRDNTVIATASKEHDAHGDLGDPSQVRLLKGAASAIASMRGLGYKIVIVTSQGGVARGKFTEDDVDACHHRVNELLREFSNTFIDRFYYCPYHPQGVVEAYTHPDHPWRKPKPGMWFEAAKDMSIDLSRSWSIGDMMRDVQAGAAAGTRTILLADQESTDHGMGHVPEFTCRDLIEAVRIMAAKKRPEPAESNGLGSGSESRDKLKAANEKLAEGEARDGSAGGNGSGRAKGIAKGNAGGNVGGKVLPTSSTRPPQRPARKFIPMEHAPVPASNESILVVDSADRDVVAGEVDDWEESNREDVVRGTVADDDSEGGAKVGAESETEKAPRVRTDAAGQENADTSGVSNTAKKTEEKPGVNEGGQVGGHVGGQVGGRSDQLLRQILQELKDQAAASRDFSTIQMMALVLQMIALTCVVGAFLMGDEEMFTFTRWIGLAIMLQLGVVTALLFDRR